MEWNVREKADAFSTWQSSKQNYDYYTILSMVKALVLLCLQSKKEYRRRATASQQLENGVTDATDKE